MSCRFQRFIHYAANSVLIEYDDPRAGEILDALVYPFTCAGAENPYAVLRFDISNDPEPIYTLYQNERKICQTGNKAGVAEKLLSQICHELAMDSRDGLLFHAAGLCYRGHGLLLPGGIGQGKSTFTAWMITLGCDYLSDELVYFPWESNTMIPFARPLHLKQPSRPVLRHLIDFDTPVNKILATGYSDLVNPTLLKADNIYSKPQAKVVLFPHYQAGSDLLWQPLSAGQTGLELLQCLINARNLPEHGFAETARLARNVSGISFTYSRFEQIAPRIVELLQAL